MKPSHWQCSPSSFTVPMMSALSPSNIALYEVDEPRSWDPQYWLQGMASAETTFVFCGRGSVYSHFVVQGPSTESSEYLQFAGCRLLPGQKCGRVTSQQSTVTVRYLICGGACAAPGSAAASSDAAAARSSLVEYGTRA